MHLLRSLVPRPGNAMRPVYFLLAGFLALMLIGFPLLMYAVGLGTTEIAWLAILILAVAVGILWFTLALSRAYDADENQLDAGEVWADWVVPEGDHRRFVERERGATRRRAIAYAVGGAALGLGLGWLQGDRLLAGIMLGAFLVASVVIWFLGGPPRGSLQPDARRVRIGPRGVDVLGRYLAFDAPLTSLVGVDVAEDDPALLRLRIRGGRRVDELRVPVPADALTQAHAVADRLRERYELA